MNEWTNRRAVIVHLMQVQYRTSEMTPTTYRLVVAMRHASVETETDRRQTFGWVADLMDLNPTIQIGVKLRTDNNWLTIELQSRLDLGYALMSAPSCVRVLKVEVK
jgi:hypothetical protein